ncbi:MAG: ABC transporter permease [Alphaproteobacteria bacterium]|nr:ABC transporter permease [Alphaproteobacteria bacterium]
MTALILTVLATSIPLLLAANGELIAERSGVLNLGVEGMMLMGAVAALGIVLYTGNPYTGIVAGALAGMAVSLALTIFATGFSGLAGAPLVGKTSASLPKIIIPLLSDLPVIGPVLFAQDLLFYLAFLIIAGTSWFLAKTRSGMILRAVGDNHDSAHALGYSVARVRWMAVAFGGACAGMGGAYIPLVLTPHWSEGMTAGRGWIALALVVFASWMPSRIVVGALIFGGITIMQLAGQARGWAVPSQVLSMLPYLATIVALVLISMRGKSSYLTVPACIGKPFHPGS